MNVSELPSSCIHPSYPICGLNIRQWNELVDVKKAKERGVKFIICRAGIGISEDKKLRKNVDLCKCENIPILFHWNWIPTFSTKDIEKAIRKTIRYGDSLFLYLEMNKTDKWPSDFEPQTVTDHLISVIEECDCITGRGTGLCSSTKFWNTWIDKPKINKMNMEIRPLWISQWTYSFKSRPSPLPFMWNRWDLWQFNGVIGPWNGKARQFGIDKSFSVDINAFNGDEKRFAELFML